MRSPSDYARRAGEVPIGARLSITLGRIPRRISCGIALAIATGLLPVPGMIFEASGAPPDRSEPSAALVQGGGDRAHGESWEAWQTLRFSGWNWLARFSAELEIELPERNGSRLGDRPPAWVAELRTSLDARFVSDKASRLRAHFDPITGVVRRVTQLSMGSRPDLKRYTFGERGVTRVRSEPAPGELFESPDRWPSGRESFHAYDPGALGCRLVSNPAALAWWLTWGPAATRVRSEDPQACYFLGKTLYRVELELIGTGNERVDYRIVREGRSRRREGKVRVERFAAVSRPIAGKLDEDTVVAEIALDVENRLPCRFAMGEGPLRVAVELEEAHLRAPSLVSGRADPAKAPRIDPR